MEMRWYVEEYMGYPDGIDQRTIPVGPASKNYLTKLKRKTLQYRNGPDDEWKDVPEVCPEPLDEGEQPIFEGSTIKKNDLKHFKYSIEKLKDNDA